MSTYLWAMYLLQYSNNQNVDKYKYYFHSLFVLNPRLSCDKKDVNYLQVQFTHLYLTVVAICFFFHCKIQSTLDWKTSLKKNKLAIAKDNFNFSSFPLLILSTLIPILEYLLWKRYELLTTLNVDTNFCIQTYKQVNTNKIKTRETKEGNTKQRCCFLCPCLSLTCSWEGEESKHRL